MAGPRPPPSSSWTKTTGSGGWVEQPRGLQEFWLDVVARGAMEQEVGRKFAWYDEEEGRETLREFVEILEAAGAGTPICPGLDEGGQDPGPGGAPVR